ncbi:MAG TPA: DNA primase [Chitinophagales bacterium]|nr:DNA primase [Chitinophagales bacterium]
MLRSIHAVPYFYAVITKETIDRIMETARVEEVVGDFVSLKKRGSNYIGLCPFHNEKTPSFNVSPSKGIYKCFGCGKAGNAVGFVMEHERFTYREALKFIAKRYNIEVEETQRSEEQVQQDTVRESLYIINGFAQNYFHEFLLQADEGRNIGGSYFRERGLNEATIQEFKLGFCPAGGSVFTDAAIAAGYQHELLKQLGLSNDQKRDFYRGRVIFPIHSISGKVLGFGGRTLSADKKVPKYVNSPESEIYNKSKVLYGMYQARQSVSSKDECFLVEGYMDVLSLYQAGITHVVASSGTALTTDQVRLIKRYTKNLTILYDGDPAGVKAALRGLDISLEEGLNVKVMLLPQGEDPDTWVQKLGAEGFLEKVSKEKKDLIHLRTSLFLEEAAGDPVKTAGVIKEIAFSISLIPDSIVRSLYIKSASTTLGLEEQILLQEVNRLIRKKAMDKLGKEDRASAESVPDQTPTQPERKPHITFHFDEPQEKDIVRLLLENSNYELEGENAIVAILRNLEDVEIDNNLYKQVVDEYRKFYEQQEFLSQSHFINHEDETIRQLCLNLLQSPYELSDNWEKMHEVYIKDKSYLVQKDIVKSISILKLKKVLRMKEEIENQLRQLQQDEAASQDMQHAMEDIRQLQDFIRQLSEVTGTVVMPYTRNK